MPDDKFVDSACDIFEEAFPGKNEFYAIVFENKTTYVKNQNIKKIFYQDLLRDNSLLSKINASDCLIVHWLDEVRKRIIENVNSKVKVLWIGWGGDYYVFIPRKLTLPLTENLLRLALSNPSSFNLSEQAIAYFISKLQQYKITEYDKKILSRINYFAPILKEDYDLLKKHLPDLNLKFANWYYGVLEKDFIIDENFYVEGNDILLGNSATPENNHLDVFEMLKKRNLSDNRNIVCPLSYGNKNYAIIIKEIGMSYFPGKFQPLTDFMPLSEYLKIISSCSNAIFNNLRQQALGNIIIMMYAGAKVFLNEQSPVYSFLKNMGACVFSLNEASKEIFNSNLTEDEIQKNREIIKRRWSKKVILENTKRLIDEIIFADKSSSFDIFKQFR